MISEPVVTATWAVRALHGLRRELRDGGLADVRVCEAPERACAQRVLDAVLGFARATCLERSLIRQAWLRAQGRQVDVIIGVTAPNDFGAHAWVDGEEPASAVEFSEIRRIRSR